MELSRADSRRLERLAEAVADGRAVDWRDASADHESLRGRVERLRVIEAIGSVHRRSRPSSAPGGRVESGALYGLSLEQCLARHGAFDGVEAARIGIEICRSLQDLHAANDGHGRLTAARIRLEEGSGRIVLPRRRRGSGDDGGGSSLLYTAPERLQGGNVTPRADVYAVGVVLYRLVSHRMPVEAASVRELTRKLRAHDRVPLRRLRPDLPARYVRTVERALAVDPAARQPDATALREDLERVLAPDIAQRLWRSVTGWLSGRPRAG